MIISGLILIFAPLIVFALDQIGEPLPFDALTLSIFLGAAGIVLLILSQRPRLPRMLGIALLSVLILVAQIFGITSFVLGQSGLS